MDRENRQNLASLSRLFAPGSPPSQRLAHSIVRPGQADETWHLSDAIMSDRFRGFGNGKAQIHDDPFHRRIFIREPFSRVQIHLPMMKMGFRLRMAVSGNYRTILPLTTIRNREREII